MHSKNTENSIVELDFEITSYQQKRYVLMKFFHREKHIVFSDVGKGRRKMEVYDGVEVLVALTV